MSAKILKKDPTPKGKVFFGGSAGIRTQDPALKRRLLYQLSYRPVRVFHQCAFETLNVYHHRGLL